ncbi:hypothetical protein ACEUCJ_15215 [Aeromonas rivipollensis]|uniref:hypothetical protein n=1 Tax=Aeromonas rivipollensis TaxID=948519 RepID=UPI0038D17696
MAAIVAPFSARAMKAEFGITSNNLSAMAPSSATNVSPAKGARPGFVPSNTKSAGGTLITSANWRNMSFFSGCYWVSGAVKLSVSAAARASASAVSNSLMVVSTSGMVASAIVTNGVATITTTHATNSVSTCTVGVNTTQAGSGTSVTYTFASFKVTTANNAYSNYVFKAVASTNDGLESTDSYSGWQAMNTTVTTAGVLSAGYNYVTIFVRNRN